MIETAPNEIARIRSQIATLQNTPHEDNLDGFPANIDLTQSQLHLTQEKAALAAFKTRLKDLESRITEEEVRPVAARAQSAEAKSMVEQLEPELKASPPSPDASESGQAQRALLEIRHRVRLYEIRMIEQEMLSSPARIELLAATRDLMLIQITQSEAKVKMLESKISQLRQAEAERVRIEVDRLRSEAIGKHQVLRLQTEEITLITRETQDLSPLIDQTNGRRETVESQLDQVKSDLEETKRTLELGALTEVLGAVLLEQKRNLQSSRDLRLASDEILGSKSSARLRLFKIDRQLRQLGDPEKVANLVLQQSIDLPENESDLAELSEELINILITKRGHLEQLAQLLRAHIKELQQLESVQDDLATNTIELASILDENLLWIRNASPIGWNTVATLEAQLVEISENDAWNGMNQGLKKDLSHQSFVYLLFFIPWSGVLLLQRKWKERLVGEAKYVGKVKEDRMGHTLSALFFTLLITSPVPVLLHFTGWRLMTLKSDLAQALGTATIIAGLTYFTIRLVRAACRPMGLGEKHFRWNEFNLALIRHHLFWFLPTATSFSFILAFTETYANGTFRDTIGRSAFMLLMLTVAVLSFFIFHPKKGLNLNGESRNLSTSWTTRTRFLWRPMAYLLPLALALLAGLGYYYMAVAFEYRLNQTILLVLLSVGLYALLFRWLIITQRRLLFKIKLEKRQASQRSRDASNEESLAQEALEVSEEFDVAEVKTQTVELLKMSVAGLLMIGLWFTWSDVLPAFRILDKVSLWDQTLMQDGQEITKAVTLSNLSLSMIIMIVTILASRNMPGFLELAVLQQLPVDHGTRYAIRTLALYFIASLGIVLAFHAIGIGWASVQWLVAALTVGLGFGLQEIFGNFVSGLIILLERPIRVGDTVTVGSISGVVTQIRMRATTITDWSRKELVVPNKSFITGELINWSLSDPILRLDFVVGIAYGSDTTLAHKTMLKVCREHPMVQDHPESTVFFTGFGDNSLNFDVRVFVTETNNTARTSIIHDLHMAIDKAFRELDIVIAFPQRDIHLNTLQPLEVNVTQIKPHKNESGSN